MSDATHVNLAVADFNGEEAPALLQILNALVERFALGNVLVTGILELLPDVSKWRLTITGDLVATVNQLTNRADGDSYTLERGSGVAGAITLPQKDGTFDIVISMAAILALPNDVGDPEETFSLAIANAAHLSRHEAGHALLRLHGEDADTFSESVSQQQPSRHWRKYLAPHMDDNRIEQYTATHAPAATSHVEHLGDAIAHLREELTESSRIAAFDIELASTRTYKAINGLFRALAYLASELGLDTSGVPNRPAPLPEGWTEYVEKHWNAWALQLARLKPVDEEMGTDKLAEVLADLCQLADDWTASIGVTQGFDSIGRHYVFWERAQY